MRKRNLLLALLICTAVSLPIRAFAADYTMEGIYQNVSQPDSNYGVLFIDTDKSAIVKAGAEFINNEAKRGAGIYNYVGGILTIEDNVKFDTNKALGAAGGAIQNFGTATMGNNLIFENNQATWGGAAIYAGSNSTNGHSTTIGSGAIFRNNTLTEKNSYGGAIFVENDNNANTAIFNLGSNSTFENNSAMEGGAVYFKNAVTATIAEGANFTNNTATSAGGAVYNLGNTTISNASFTGNTSNGKGGAIYNAGDLSVAGTFNKNSAKGGAIYSTANLTVADGSTFNSNTAKGNGGAIYLDNSISTTIGNNVQFNNNEATSTGGAVYLYNSKKAISDSTLTIGEGVIFNGNSATSQQGGALYVYHANSNSYKTEVTIGDDVQFLSNTSGKAGGAVYTTGNTEMSIGKNAVFDGNTSTKEGGAIYNNNNNGLTIGDGASFSNNKGSLGGAIYQAADKELSLNLATFNSNTATGAENSAGGAILIASNDTNAVTITNSSFDGNKSDIAGGAILQMDGSTSTITINNTTFTNNTTGAEGGAIVSDSTLTVTNSIFRGNSTTGTTVDATTPLNSDGGGGAIFLYDEGKATVLSSTFSNNSSGTYGGAIATRVNASNNNSSLTIDNSSFDGNSADINGGAVAAYIDATITDSSFTNNTAGENGGAVWANKDLTVNAVNSDIVMSGNSASDGGDIYMNTDNSNLNLNAAEGKSITLASGVSGNKSGYNMVVNSDSNTGSVIINSAIQNANISVNNGTFHLAQGSALNNSTLNMAGNSTLSTINNEISAFGNNITLADSTNLAVDLNVATGQADNFANAAITDNNKVVVADVNPIGASNTTANSVSINILEAMGLNSDKASVSEALISETKTVLTPIRYLQGSVSEDGILTMAPTGKNYKDFNPSVMASPVAAQLGGYLTQLNSYDEAFKNMDMYMLMTKKQRTLMKNINKYALTETPDKYYHVETSYEERGGWVRPYATFEKVDLRGGPKVSNVAYGTFIGGESEMYDLGHGWDGIIGAYIGYNGSHQSFNGISTYQNGGTLGLVGMAYKGDFFTGLTINAGANAGEASTMYGNDNFTMLMAGIASKTGYNIELAEGKFIIQPSVLMSYSFINTFDYTNAAGVRIDSDPLNAIHVEPGIKFIGNLKNGWQPYAGVSMVWNIMDKTDFKANDVSLPDLSVKPYVKYGLGVRKTWGERITGFFQCFFTSGGRNGVGLQAGFRLAIGKNGKNNSVRNNMPEPPKTKIKLSNMR